jgi:hypothetical protein
VTIPMLLSSCLIPDISRWKRTSMRSPRLSINCWREGSGDVSQLAHDNAMKRVIQAGAKPVTALSVMLEWQRDWAERDTYDAVMDIVKSQFGAYGMGVEYAYTMVHGAPATKFPEYVVPAATPAHK